VIDLTVVPVGSAAAAARLARGSSEAGPTV